MRFEFNEHTEKNEHDQFNSTDFSRSLSHTNTQHIHTAALSEVLLLWMCVFVVLFFLFVKVLKYCMLLSVL